MADGKLEPLSRQGKKSFIPLGPSFTLRPRLLADLR